MGRRHIRHHVSEAGRIESRDGAAVQMVARRDYALLGRCTRRQRLQRLVRFARPGRTRRAAAQISGGHHEDDVALLGDPIELRRKRAIAQTLTNAGRTKAHIEHSDVEASLGDRDLIIEMVEELFRRSEVPRRKPAPRHQIDVVEAAHGAGSKRGASAGLRAAAPAARKLNYFSTAKSRNEES